MKTKEEMQKPYIPGWELKTNENGVEMAILPAQQLRELLIYAERMEECTTQSQSVIIKSFELASELGWQFNKDKNYWEHDDETGYLTSDRLIETYSDSRIATQSQSVCKHCNGAGQVEIAKTELNTLYEKCICQSTQSQSDAVEFAEWVKNGFNGQVVLKDLLDNGQFVNENGMSVIKMIDNPNGGFIAYIRHDAMVKKLNTLVNDFSIFLKEKGAKG